MSLLTEQLKQVPQQCRDLGVALDRAQNLVAPRLRLAELRHDVIPALAADAYAHYVNSVEDCFLYDIVATVCRDYPQPVRELVEVECIKRLRISMPGIEEPAKDEAGEEMELDQAA